MTVRPAWRWLPWVRWGVKRRQAQALAAARRWQQQERDAARHRILDAARGNQARRAPEGWHTQPTTPLPQVNRPLMTPAAEHRTRRNRWI